MVLGLESGAASGWPGTDWLEDIVLRQAGPEMYDQWCQGKVRWTSPEIKRGLADVGHDRRNDRDGLRRHGRRCWRPNFGDGGNPLFHEPAQGCYLHHQGSFITDFFTQANPNLKPVEDYNFFPFPDIDPQYAGSLEVAGDLFGMFKDTPQARALIST